jgi:hypothetical protein
VPAPSFTLLVEVRKQFAIQAKSQIILIVKQSMLGSSPYFILLKLEILWVDRRKKGTHTKGTRRKKGSGLAIRHSADAPSRPAIHAKRFQRLRIGMPDHAALMDSSVSECRIAP